MHRETIAFSPSSGTARSSSRPPRSPVRCARSRDEVLVHTGQHYDAELSQVFFDELELPRPEHLLDLGGGTNTEQTGAHAGRAGAAAGRRAARRWCSSTATRTRRWRARWPPRRRGIPVAHVEAGMRSFDRAMPEELNRVLTDHASDLLLCSVGRRRPRTCAARASPGEVEVVGDVMVDVAQLLAPRARGAHRGAGARAASSPASTCSPPRTAPATSTTRSAWRALVALLQAAARAGRAAAAPAHARAAGGRRAARELEAASDRSRRRSATWTSPRCCCTRARC